MDTMAGGKKETLLGGIVALLILVTPPVSLARPGPASDTTAGSAALYRVTFRDGSELVGKILRQSADSLTIRIGNGLTFPVSRLQVKEMQVLSGKIVDGEYRRSDPNVSRLFFGPTARPVRGGYVAAYELFFPFVSFGIADVVTIAGGMTLFPGASEQLFYIAPKLSLPLGTEELQIAAGALYTNITGGEAGGAGIAYGVTTIGSHDASLTFGMGLGFAGGEFAESPILMIGGEARLSNSMALISENWIPTGSDVQLLSLGFRFFGDHLSADLGLMHPVTSTGMSGFPLFPWLGFCYTFGEAR